MSGLPSRRAHWRWFLYAVLVRARRVAGLSAQAAKKGLVSLYNSDDLTHAASIAYYSLLSLFPFLLLLVSSGPRHLTHRRARRDAELRPALLPDAAGLRGAPARGAAADASPAGPVRRVRADLGVARFFSAISTAVNYAWKVERNRSYLKHKLVAFLMMVTACGLLALTVFVFA
jgi:uncharacterized BrkB/YihY/UPF0761 family membrane protein